MNEQEGRVLEDVIKRNFPKGFSLDPTSAQIIEKLTHEVNGYNHRLQEIKLEKEGAMERERAAIMKRDEAIRRTNAAEQAEVEARVEISTLIGIVDALVNTNHMLTKVMSNPPALLKHREGDVPPEITRNGSGSRLVRIPDYDEEIWK